MGKRGQTHVYLALATVFVAVFTLFFIFHNLELLAEKCDTESASVCEQFTGFTHSMIVVLLIIGGFVITVSATVYLLLST